MKAAIRIHFAFLLLLGVLLGLPKVGEARRIYIVREPNGKTRIVDPQNTFKYKVTHPWAFFRKPYNYVRRSVTPSKSSAQGYDQVMTQQQMATPPSLTSRITSRLNGAVSTVGSVPVVESATKPVSRFFRKKPGKAPAAPPAAVPPSRPPVR